MILLSTPRMKRASGFPAFAKEGKVPADDWGRGGG